MISESLYDLSITSVGYIYKNYESDCDMKSKWTLDTVAVLIAASVACC